MIKSKSKALERAADKMLQQYETMQKLKELGNKKHTEKSYGKNRVS
jgi:hypothetical protein